LRTVEALRDLLGREAEPDEAEHLHLALGEARERSEIDGGLAERLMRPDEVVDGDRLGERRADEQGALGAGRAIEGAHHEAAPRAVGRAEPDLRLAVLGLERTTDEREAHFRRARGYEFVERAAERGV